MSVGEKPVGEVSIGETSVWEVSVGEVFVAEVSVGEVFVGDVAVGEISVGELSRYPIFQTFECSNESSPNSSRHFRNCKVKVYSNFASLFSVMKNNSSVFL